MSKRTSLFLFIIPIVAFLVFATGLSSQEKPEPVYLVTIDDYIINPVVEEYISNAIRSAQRNGQCLIIQLDTPGGLLSSTRKIVKRIMASKVPVVVYVSPKGARAGSAGVFITISSHIAAMAPSTNIGAAHPVQMGERKSTSDVIKEIIKYFKKTDEDKARKKKKVEPIKEEKDIMSEKIMSDTLAWVSTIARTRKRNVDWARKAVLESASVTETEAKDLGVIDLVA